MTCYIKSIAITFSYENTNVPWDLVWFIRPSGYTLWKLWVFLACCFPAGVCDDNPLRHMCTHNTPTRTSTQNQQLFSYFAPQWGWFLLSEQQLGETKHFFSLCWDSSHILNVLTGCGGIVGQLVCVIDERSNKTCWWLQWNWFLSASFWWKVCVLWLPFLHFLADNYGGYENQLFKGNDGSFLLPWAQKHTWQPVHDHQPYDKHSSVNWIQSLRANLGEMYDGKLHFWISKVKWVICCSCLIWLVSEKNNCYKTCNILKNSFTFWYMYMLIRGDKQNGHQEEIIWFKRYNWS